MHDILMIINDFREQLAYLDWPSIFSYVNSGMALGINILRLKAALKSFRKVPVKSVKPYRQFKVKRNPRRHSKSRRRKHISSS